MDKQKLRKEKASYFLALNRQESRWWSSDRRGSTADSRILCRDSTLGQCEFQLPGLLGAGKA